jgi:hypothetical protein
VRACESTSRGLDGTAGVRFSLSPPVLVTNTGSGAYLREGHTHTHTRTQRGGAGLYLRFPRALPPRLSVRVAPVVTAAQASPCTCPLQAAKMALCTRSRSVTRCGCALPRARSWRCVLRQRRRRLSDSCQLGGAYGAYLSVGRICQLGGAYFSVGRHYLLTTCGWVGGEREAGRLRRGAGAWQLGGYRMPGDRWKGRTSKPSPSSLRRKARPRLSM